jgi:hydrogenase maturation factor
MSSRKCGKTPGYVPEARADDYVLVHLGIPVEVLRAKDAEAALDLRAAEPA